MIKDVIILETMTCFLHEKGEWSRGDLLALFGILVTIAGVLTVKPQIFIVESASGVFAFGYTFRSGEPPEDERFRLAE